MPFVTRVSYPNMETHRREVNEKFAVSSLNCVQLCTSPKIMACLKHSLTGAQSLQWCYDLPLLSDDGERNAAPSPSCHAPGFDHV